MSGMLLATSVIVIAITVKYVIITHVHCTCKCAFKVWSHDCFLGTWLAIGHVICNKFL